MKQMLSIEILNSRDQKSRSFQVQMELCCNRFFLYSLLFFSTWKLFCIKNDELDVTFMNKSTIAPVIYYDELSISVGCLLFIRLYFHLMTI